MANPFLLEQKREAAAIARRKKRFLSLYAKGLPEIADHNSPQLWEEHLAEDNTHSKMGQDRIRWITDYITHFQAGKNKIVSLFDIGVGNAPVEKELQKSLGSLNDFDLHGIDITTKNIKKLSSQLNGHFKLGNILDYKPTRTYDVVMMLEVLEHLQPQSTFKVLKTILKTLKNEGVFIISVPIYEDLQEKIQAGTNYSAHVRRYTPALIAYELECAGFKIIQTKTWYAFGMLYQLKTLVARLTGIRRPNSMVLICQK